MKILHLITSMHTGGAERFCVDLCNSQSSVGNNSVTLCVLDELTIKDSMLEELSNRVELITLKKKSGFDLKTIWNFTKFLLANKFDVIHVSGRALIYSSLPIILTGNKAVYTVHTLAQKEYNKYFLAYNRLLFRIFSKRIYLIGISRAVASSIEKVYGIDSVKVIYNGSIVNDDNITSDRDEFTNNLVYIGRIAPEKNVILLIKSVIKLIKDGIDIKLTIVGGDPTIGEQYLPQCINAGEGRSNIVFEGRRKDIHKFILRADALCLSSDYEGLGIAALEAFSCGKPVISTPCGGPEEIIIHGVNGVISRSNTIEDYSFAILECLNFLPLDAAKIKDIHRNNYSVDICSRNYLEYYNDIVK